MTAYSLISHEYFPNGQQYLVAHKKIAATYFLDTLTFNIKTNAFTALGLNQFSIKVESDNHIVESSETNNNLTVDLLILSDDIIPVYPYEFSIVNHQSVTLKASTVNAFATSKQYVFQIDTTENFNSSLFQEIKINQIGGVAKWTPAVTLHDSTVYYWRTSLDTLYNNGFSWHNSSFIYINGSSLGWNQSHYFQYLKDKFGSIELLLIEYLNMPMTLLQLVSTMELQIIIPVVHWVGMNLPTLLIMFEWLTDLRYRS